MSRKNKKPVIVNGVDLTKVEGVDLKTKSDLWMHNKELEMTGKHNYNSTKKLKTLFESENYTLPSMTDL